MVRFCDFLGERQRAYSIWLWLVARARFGTKVKCLRLRRGQGIAIEMGHIASRSLTHKRQSSRGGSSSLGSGSFKSITDVFGCVNRAFSVPKQREKWMHFILNGYTYFWKVLIKAKV